MASRPRGCRRASGRARGRQRRVGAGCRRRRDGAWVRYPTSAETRLRAGSPASSRDWSRSRWCRRAAVPPGG